MSFFVLGFPVTTIQWLKDGQPLNFGSRIRQISNTQIQIYSVSKEDKGMYQCIVKNDLEMSQGSAELQLGGEFFFLNSHCLLI